MLHVLQLTMLLYCPWKYMFRCNKKTGIVNFFFINIVLLDGHGILEIHVDGVILLLAGRDSFEFLFYLFDCSCAVKIYHMFTLCCYVYIMSQWWFYFSFSYFIKMFFLSYLYSSISLAYISFWGIFVFFCLRLY